MPNPASGGLRYPNDARTELHFDYSGPTFGELNTVTQSGATKMLRRDRWKLVYDGDGNGELYDLGQDPAELDNRFADPALADVRTALIEDLLRWCIRTEDDLPRAAYTLKPGAAQLATPARPIAHRGEHIVISRQRMLKLVAATPAHGRAG